MPTLRNVTAGIDLSTTVSGATSAFDRFVGMLRISHILPHEGLWLRPCSAIHTIGMRTPIDVIFIDHRSIVVKLHSRLQPNRFWISHRRTKSVIEMGPGFLDASTIAVGDELALIDDTEASGGVVSP